MSVIQFHFLIYNEVMKRLLNPKLQILLAACLIMIMLGFLLLFVGAFFTLALNKGDLAFLKDIISAFAGAFFAFLFLRIAEIGGKLAP